MILLVTWSYGLWNLSGGRGKWSSRVIPAPTAALCRSSALGLSEQKEKRRNGETSCEQLLEAPPGYLHFLQALLDIQLLPKPGQALPNTLHTAHCWFHLLTQSLKKWCKSHSATPATGRETPLLIPSALLVKPFCSLLWGPWPPCYTD